MLKNNIISILLLFSITAFISGCGGGSNNDNPADNGGSSSNELNSGLQGSFFWSSYDGFSKKLDIPSGRWLEIPVIENWIDQNKDMHNIDRLYNSLTRFTNDGQFALKVIQDCDNEVGGVLDNIIAQCFVVFDLNNEAIIGEFKISPVTGRHLDSIALSNDGQNIAVLDRKNSERYRLRIYDLAGNEIDESFYSDRLLDEFVQVESLEWLPDGRLIFSYGPVIMRSVDPYSTSAKVLKVFSKTQGEPIHLRVSPDGEKIAYALKTDSTFVSLDSTLWVMDVDGDNSYQIVEALDSTQPEMNNPAWSQDGEQIVFQFGGVNGVSGTSPGLPSGLLVVPSDAIKASVSYKTSEISSNILRITSYYTPGRDDWSSVDDHRLRDSFPDGRVTWVLQ